MKENSKRSLILHAAKECFKLKGYYGTGIDEIAKTAGITKSLLYYYFKSKDDIFIALLKESLERLVNYISDEDPDNLRENFEKFLNGIKEEKDVLTIGLVDLLMGDAKTNMILELSELKLNDASIKYNINDDNRFLYIMFIIRAVCYFSLGGKICSYFGMSFDKTEKLNKEELFSIYCKLHEQENINGGII